MRTTLRQLRTLLSVAEHRSISRAARALNVSQPAVTHAIAEMEQVYGVPLFERGPKGVVPTPFGTVLIQRGQAVFAELRRADYEIAALSGEASGSVAVGTSPFGAGGIVPAALNAMVATTPDLAVFVLEAPYPSLIAGLRVGELDLVVAALGDPAISGEFVEEELYRDHLVLQVRAGHPLTADPPVSLADLLDWPWILPPRWVRPRELLNAAFQKDGIPPPRGGVETQSMLVLRTMLLAGDWIAPLPREIFLDERNAGRMAELPITLGGFLRPVGILTRGHALGPAQLAMMEALRQAARRITKT